MIGCSRDASSVPIPFNRKGETSVCANLRSDSLGCMRVFPSDLDQSSI